MNQVKKKFDQNAINEFFENLLDKVGEILDKSGSVGFTEIYARNKVFEIYFQILATIEEELLIEWKIFQTEGVDQLLERQKKWYHQNLRSKNSLFNNWNKFTKKLNQNLVESAGFISVDPWKSFLIANLTEYKYFKNNAGVISSNEKDVYLDSVCDLFKIMDDYSLEHIVISFLNLIEISVGKRPDIYPLYQQDNERFKEQKPKVVHATFKEEISQSDFTQTAEKLKKFWKNNSGGKYSLYPAFVLKTKKRDNFYLQPVMPEKQIKFDDLIGIEKNRDKLIENTRKFIKNEKAQHILIWGGRGTGKSSSVMALIDEFADQGLRLIEVVKEDLHLINDLSIKLSGRPEKFIVFCDDLGFEKENFGINRLKSLMEGSVLQPSSNLLVIATSNRKDLAYKGELDMRYPEQKQMLDEKRALDDRFGLKLFYECPARKHLLKFYHLSWVNLKSLII